mgnify:FL=1
MKPYLSSILLLIFLSTNENLYSQNHDFLKITYAKEYHSKIDTTKTKSFKKEIGNLNSLIAKYSKEVSYQLIISNHHSLFSQNELNMNESDYNYKKIAGSIGGTDGKYYINKKEANYLNEIHFLGDDFLISLVVKNWETTNEFKLISGFKCYKATSEDIVSNSIGIFKSKVIAWFCPELPSFFGPAEYFGLPGLILELDNGKMKLRATKIHISKSKKDVIKPLKNGIKLTKKEFDELLEKKARAMFPKSFKNKK